MQRRFYMSRSLACLILALIVSNVFSAVPSYTLKKAPQSITVDGVLDERLWSKLDSFSLVDCTSGSAPSQATTVKAAWDEQYLYLSITAKDKDVWATITAHDGNLYTEEMLEFFIDPDRDGKNYFEYEFNCLGALMDMFMMAPYGTTGGGGNISWTSSNINFKVKVHGSVNNQSDVDTSYILEAKIPWADLKFNTTTAPQPKAGDRMAINVYRGDGRQTKTYSCWSPVGGSLPGSFHSPQLFGTFVFSDSLAYQQTAAESHLGNSLSFAGYHIRCILTSSGLKLDYTALENAHAVFVISAISGKTIRQFSLDNGHHSMALDFPHHLSPGIYIVRLLTKQENVTEKTAFYPPW